MHFNKILLTLFLLLVVPLWAGAEVIVLKDGTLIEAAKVWEDNGYIKFSPVGYEGIVITYAKEIIDRIGDKKIGVPEEPATETEESVATQANEPPPHQKEATQSVNTPVVEPAPESAAPEKAPPAVSATPPEMKPPRTESRKAPEAAAPPPAKPAKKPPAQQKDSPEGAVDESAYSEYDGMQFYEPRRTYKYRTGQNTWHRTLEEALASLAATFEHSTDWVEQNLGNTNDLGQIYRNLQLSKLQPAGSDPDENSGLDGIAFYDPRRHYKYWVDANTKYRTLEEALQELARRYDRTPDWVRENIGDANDLGQIYRNLAQRKIEEAATLKEKK
jgi:hypothetical protein